jgi:hypothetical protein
MTAVNPGLTNLLSWWKFDETSGNAADAVGTNALTNNGSTGFTSGLIGNAADLGTANTTKYFSKASALGFSVNAARSYGCTFKVRTELSGSNQYRYIMQLRHGSNGVNYDLGYYRESDVNKLYGGRGRNAVADDGVYYNVNLGTSNYHQAIVTFDGTTQILYLDGTAVGNNNPNTGNGTSRSDGFGIGADAAGGAGSFMNEYADESFYFNDVLTADEVTWLWNGGNGRTYEDLRSGGQVMIWQSE